MQAYQKQLDAMIAALASGNYSPPAEINREFKRARLNVVSRALGLTNIFVAVNGHFAQASSRSTFSGYTKPLQRDVIVLGCSLMTYDERVENRLAGEFRLRLPEPLAHLSQNYIFPGMAFAPATYSIFFPAPFILKASEQIGFDFGWNAPQANQVTNTDNIEIVLFCTTVKDCLASEDIELLETATRIINDTDYQRRVLLNSATVEGIAVTSQTDSPFYSGSGNQVTYPQQPLSSVAVPKGSLTASETRIADIPLLVIGLGINSCGEAIRVTDTGSGHSFTMGDFVYSHSLWYPEEFTTFTGRGPYNAFFRLPVPHLLKPGATLFTEHLATELALQNSFNPEYMVWECLQP